MTRPVLTVAVGVACVVAGVALWSVPASLIVIGLACITAGLLYRYEEKP